MPMEMEIFQKKKTQLTSNCRFSYCDASTPKKVICYEEENDEGPHSGICSERNLSRFGSHMSMSECLQICIYSW